MIEGNDSTLRMVTHFENGHAPQRREDHLVLTNNRLTIRELVEKGWKHGTCIKLRLLIQTFQFCVKNQITVTSLSTPPIW